jgi:hypothetical protein
MYTNATSLNNKIDELRAINCTNEMDVISITETWYKETSDININGYNVYRKDRLKQKGGGVCIYINNRLCSYEVSIDQLNDQSIEQVWTCAEYGKEKILIGCIYRPPDTNNATNVKIMKSIRTAKEAIIKKLFTSVIINGDFNYSNLCWNDTDKDIVYSQQADEFIDCFPV